MGQDTNTEAERIAPLRGATAEALRNIAGYRQHRTAQQTGTVVLIVDGEAQGIDDSCDRWMLECTDHGCTLTTRTLALAKHHGASPLDWCDGCAEAQRTTEAPSVTLADRLDALDTETARFSAAVAAMYAADPAYFAEAPAAEAAPWSEAEAERVAAAGANRFAAERAAVLTRTALRRSVRLAAAAAGADATEARCAGTEAAEALGVLRALASTALGKRARNVATLGADDVAGEAAARLLGTSLGRDALRVLTEAPTTEAEAEALRRARGAVRSVIGTALRSMTTEAAGDAVKLPTEAERIAARVSTTEAQRLAVLAAIEADGAVAIPDGDHQRAFRLGAAGADGWALGKQSALTAGAGRSGAEAAARLAERGAVRTEAKRMPRIAEAGNYRSNVAAAENRSDGAVRVLRETSLERMMTEALRWKHAQDVSTTEAERLARAALRTALAERLAGANLTGRAGSARLRLALAVRRTEREAPAERLATLTLVAALATLRSNGAEAEAERLRLLAKSAPIRTEAERSAAAVAGAVAGGASATAAALGREAARLRMDAAIWRSATAGGRHGWTLAGAVTAATFSPSDTRHGGAAKRGHGEVDWLAVLASMRPALGAADVADKRMADALRVEVRRAAAAVAGVIGWAPASPDAVATFATAAPLRPAPGWRPILTRLGAAEARRWRRLAVLSTIDRVAQWSPLVIGAERTAAAPWSEALRRLADERSIGAERASVAATFRGVLAQRALR